MKALSRAGLVVSALVAGLGCGGSAGPSPSEGEPQGPSAGAADPGAPGPAAPGTPGTPGARPVPPAPLPDPVVDLPAGAEERRILQAVAPDHLAEMYRLVGRYVRGDAPVYQGSFTARDNMGSLGSTYRDGVMTNANVNASLAWEEKIYWSGQHVAGWTLMVRSDTHRIRISQSPSRPGESVLSLVVPNNTSGGLTGTCAGCVPALAPTASTVSIANVVANGKWGNNLPLQVTASGSLTRVPTSQLTFERLVAVVDPSSDGRTMLQFAATGSDMVRTESRTFTEPTTIPPGKTYYSCERVTSYTLDWFVDRNRLVRYGLRNMTLAGAQTCCNEGPPGACQPKECF